MELKIKSSTRVHEIVELFKNAFPQMPEIILMTQKKNPAGNDRRLVALTEIEIPGKVFQLTGDYNTSIKLFTELTGIEITVSDSIPTSNQSAEKVVTGNTVDSSTQVVDAEKLQLEEERKRILAAKLLMEEEKSKLEEEKIRIEEEKNKLSAEKEKIEIDKQKAAEEEKNKIAKEVNNETLILTRDNSKKLREDEVLKRLISNFFKDAFQETINIVEEDPTLMSNEEIVDQYLYALQQNAGTDINLLEKALKKILKYIEIFPPKNERYLLVGEVYRVLGKEKKNITYLIHAIYYYKEAKDSFWANWTENDVSELINKLDNETLLEALSCAKKTSNIKLVKNIESLLDDTRPTTSRKSEETIKEFRRAINKYEIRYSIKLKEDAGFLNSFTNKMSTIASGKGFLNAMSQKDNKGGYRDREIIIEHEGDLSESAAKKYVISKDKDIKEGIAGSSTIIINKIIKI